MGKLNVQVALIFAGLAACAQHRPGVFAGDATPSGGVCGANVDTDTLNGVHLRLTNTSTSRECRATRLTLEFKAGVEQHWIQVSTPSGWRQSYVPCSAGGRACGVSWYRKAGVAAGESLGGFVVLCDPRRLKNWTVDLGGKRQVSLPYGWVDGWVGPAPEE